MSAWSCSGCRAGCGCRSLALAVSGGVDLVSVVLRQTILPLVTPDELRGRVNAVEMIFISASNELGAFESGVAAALVGAVPAVVVGGIATIVIAAAWSRVFPHLAHVDRLDDLRPASALRRSLAPELAPRAARSLPAGTPLIDASTSSIGWRAGSGCPRRPSAVASWTRQPGLALAQHLRVGGEHVACLSLAELARRIGLDDVVDPGRSAAEVLLGGLDDLERGDARERRARCERQALRVTEVAGVLERDAEGERMPRRARLRRLEQLAHVANAGRERRRPVGPGRIVSEQPAELLQMGSAARGVDDDEPDVGGLERLDQPAGEAPCLPRDGRRARRAPRSSPAVGATTS